MPCFLLNLPFTKKRSNVAESLKHDFFDGFCRYYLNASLKYFATPLAKPMRNTSVVAEAMLHN